MAHRGRLLELDIDTASRGVFDGLLGLVVEVIVLQAVAGRSHGGEMGAGARATHPSDRRTWPRSTRRTMEGGIAWMWRSGEGCASGCVCVCERVRKGFCGPKQGTRVLGKERVRFLTRKGRQRCSLLCQWALTQKRTPLGSGALEVGDHRLLEDGRKRGGALGSDEVVPDTARDGWGQSERAGACQRALTGKQTFWGGGALERGHGAALEPFAQLGGVEVADLIVGQAARMEVVSI